MSTFRCSSCRKTFRGTAQRSLAGSPVCSACRNRTTGAIVGGMLGADVGTTTAITGALNTTTSQQPTSGERHHGRLLGFPWPRTKRK